MTALKKLQAIQRASLIDLERRLSKHEYLCGREISIADLVACCELESLRFLQQGEKLLDGDKFTRTKQWFTKMVEENPIV